MSEIGMHEAKTNLSKLVERAQHGEEIVITKNGVPVVRLEPVKTTSRMAAVRGVLKEQIWIADDFNDLSALDDEFKEAFGLE